MDKFIHSVQLDTEACRGCINCIKYCPTQAIRVQNGKARIKPQFCVDCGRCIRYCPHHAKIPVYDSVEEIQNYKYTVALPAPSLYSQFNNLKNVDVVLNALLSMGFDDVFEVSAAAELVSEASRAYISEHRDEAPFISTACPSIVRIVRVKFPTLIPRLLPLKPPVEVAAEIARKKAAEKSGLAPEEIGIFFISPCPSKVTYAKAPLGIEKSQIDKVLAIKDVYPILLEHMTDDETKLKPLASSGRIGIGWSNAGGEAAGLITDDYLACDGIMGALRVLSDLEDEKFHGLKFVELNACNGGCVGGPLTVENPYVATAKSKKLHRYLPVAQTHGENYPDIDYHWSSYVEYEPVFRLGDSFLESLEMMGAIEELTEQLPGLDCGSCGAPTCRALAEDIVRGEASKNDCIYLFHEYINTLAKEIAYLSHSPDGDGESGEAGEFSMEAYIEKLTTELDKRER
ncbi:4Fe-4S dicluster domain-containing protein [Lachnospiraceae bacterium KGMB03038]|nr:4Fe-4S dicluster domain-containing protein [Lachnospiraceae bacterium KGMB03038]